MFKKACLSIITILFSTFAVANPTCSGTVSGVSMSGGGSVYATVRNGGGTNLTDVVFCNINSTSGNFSGEACKGVLSLLISSAAMQKNVTLWFKDAQFDDCTQSWKNLNGIGLYHLRVNG